MSAEKYLNEADWKKFAKGKDYKDAALLKALAGLDKAERAGAAPQLAALDDISRQGQVLLKAAKGDKELAAYLDSLDKAVEKQRKLLEKLDEAERKAAKKEEEDDEDETPALLTVKMIPLLRAVPKGEILHALIASTGKDLAVLVARRPIAPSRRKLLSSYLGASGSPKFFSGQCLFEEKAHTFVLDTAATGLAKKLKAALLKQTELRFKVRVRGTDPGDVDDDGEALDEGAEPATTEPATAPSAQPAGEARLAALAQAVENAARQRPADAAKLQALLAFARGKADAGQWAAAVQALDSIDTLLAAAPPAPSPAADPAPAFNARLAALIAQLKAAAAGNHPAVPALKLKLGEAGGRARTKDFAAAQALLDEAEALLAGGAGGSDDWPQARAAWRDALEAVDAQLDAVRGRMLASGDPDFRKIADLGLPALTRNHKTPVMAALMDIDRSAGEARLQAGERARQAVAAFRAHVRSDSKFRVLDEQSTAAFGVPLSLRQSLEVGLSSLDRAIARLT